MGINLNGQDVEWSISSIVTEYQIPKTLTCFNLYYSQSCFVLSMELILSNSCMRPNTTKVGFCCSVNFVLAFAEPLLDLMRFK